jgi:riboflavin kinase
VTPYQDIIDDAGNVLVEGYRSCADRYSVVRDVAATLRKPFTVLDIGAASGYFSIRLTQEFGARCVAVDRDASVLGATGRVAAVVNRDVSAEDVRRLGTFDMVLGLSVLHHIPTWRAMLDMMVRVARSALIVETPHPAERLRSAKARHALADIDSTLRSSGMERMGEATAVWQRALPRGLYVQRWPGAAVEGRAFSGSGSNGKHTVRFAAAAAEVLGYVPFPGSLNVRTSRAFRLGAYAAEYVDAARGRGGRRGGDYQLWHARVEGYNGPAHVMRPGQRGHGRDVLEVWAPVKLKDVLGIRDGDTVRLRIGA